MKTTTTFLLVLLFVLILLILCKCLKPKSENFSKFQNCDLMSIAPSTTTGPRLPVPKNSKFIVFQIDCGGLNNIRMQFEILTIIAWLSKRTLVLFPKTNWYLLGNEKLYAYDIFDFDCWASKIPLLKSSEWLKYLGKSDEPDYNKFFRNIESGEYGKVFEPSWSPGKTKFDLEFLKNEDQVWYFYCDRFAEYRNREGFRNLDHRMFGNTECYFEDLNKETKKKMRKLIWDSIKFKEDYYIEASKLLKKMKLKIGEYNALHLRNWEGSQPQYRKGSQEEIIDNILTLDKSKPILFLSQDVIVNIPEKIRSKVKKFMNSYNLIRPIQINNRFRQSIIDMLLAVPAYRFFGSPSSTYSTGIIQLRGNFSRFCNKIDDTIYFLDKKDYTSCQKDSWNFHIVKEEVWKGM